LETILTEIPISDIPRRMGRPSLGIKPTLVRLSDEVRERIRSLVGDSGMAAFIREAVERELKRREGQKRKGWPPRTEAEQGIANERANVANRRAAARE
jgi:hypothetical protein